MYRPIPALASVFLFLSPVALAQDKADFIDGTYVLNPEGCAMLRARAVSGVENADTTPWTVSADGISFWEGGCAWSRVEKTGENTWALAASCEDGLDSYSESYVYRRLRAGELEVTLTTEGASEKDRRPHTYLRCEAA
ncbi:MAG: hypothetical protein JNM45_02775 [Rhizobiales bacterium]|nr:hypothetical protein [Hyphomicrobiales bacterium]